MRRFADCGVCVPGILLPAQKDMSSWCVIACDQYTQDSGYWENVTARAGDKPSTLRLILPELYLSSPDCDRRIAAVRKSMQDYLSSGVFAPEREECIYVERTTAYGRVRKGLVLAVDLDCYEWRPGNKALIRATEATIASRIPPRKKIREGAPLESPHIMLLVDDRDGLLIDSCAVRAKREAPVYDGDLMLGAGHVTGWAVASDDDLAAVHAALREIKTRNTQEDGSSFLFAVGDGNHSLATAKAVWDEYKERLLENGASPEELDSCPVRYALVEVVSIYDEGLTFEPIHRVLFGASHDELVSFLAAQLTGTALPAASEDELSEKVHGSSADFGIVSADGNGAKKLTLLTTGITELAVSRLQPALDQFARERDLKMDYIHGDDEVFRLGARKDAVALLLPPVDKASFFATIAANGPLPRKSFSMGEASEKRFYLECRKLFPKEGLI